MQIIHSTHQTIPLPRRTLPPLARVRQNLPREPLNGIPHLLRSQFESAGILKKIRPGDEIGITGSSRGMGGFLSMLKALVAMLKESGARPFILPAMGSHGGATENGQIEILRKLGVTEETIGAPIRATMETRAIGTAENGAVAHLDTIASAADGIIIFERVKIHPETVGDFASGLLKCVTIGLGKQHGAREAHNHGLWESVRSVARITMDHAKILCGVAVVENGYHEPVHIEVVPPRYEAFLEADIRLLRKANQFFPRIPFDDLDLLIVDEIGKNIAGSGMDPNVVGTWRVSGGPHEPDFRRIVVLSLTPESLGNGIGIGFADFTTERFMREYDPMVTWVNVLTATEPGGNTREGVLPLALPSDRDAIQVALYSSLAGDKPRICRIKNTEDLETLWVSEGMLDDVRRKPALEVVEEPVLMQFDEHGNLF